jgi:hypothetical protein
MAKEMKVDQDELDGAWREALKGSRPMAERPDENWATVDELAGLCGCARRWVQILVCEGLRNGSIRDPVIGWSANSGHIKYWYGPDVAKERLRRQKVNANGSEWKGRKGGEA